MTDEAKLICDKEEAQAFWLLFTLIGMPEYPKGNGSNGVLKQYYGVYIPLTPAGAKGNDLQPPLAHYQGASDDIYHLNSCVSRYLPNLWIHMSALGFHLASVFHGFFMSMGAFYMPTATVFRFWDLFISESTRHDH